MDRPNGGFRRGYSQGNRIETQQATTDRLQLDRQEDWSVPANMERQENETESHEITQPPPPPNIPPPTDDRLFTDWSSMDSPRGRVSQHDQSARSIELNITVIQNRTIYNRPSRK